MSTIKEDGTSMLTDSAAQDYIHELESHVRMMRSSNTKAINLVEEYQSSKGFELVFKDLLLRMLTDKDVLEYIVSDVKASLEIADLEYRLDKLEEVDEYQLIDTVVDSMTFESRVSDLVDEKLIETNFKVIIEE